MVRPTDFEKIRKSVKIINALYGGKITIEEWTVGDEELLKVSMTWKQPRVKEPGLEIDAPDYDIEIV